MTITLPREQQERLEAEVAAGVYKSVDEAVAGFVAEHMDADVDDLAWAKPLIDEARASFERGEFVTLEEHRARMEKRFGKLDR